MPSDSQQIDERDPETGQFVVGHTGKGGRPKGSRNKLGEAFVSDLFDEWTRSGANALKRVVQDDPTAFVRVVAQILPREIDATLTTVDVELFAEAKTFAQAYRLAQRYLGADVENESPALIEVGDAAPVA